MEELLLTRLDQMLDARAEYKIGLRKDGVRVGVFQATIGDLDCSTAGGG